MITVPSELLEQYRLLLDARGVLESNWSNYSKWLRYFLDFCEKYPIPPSKTELICQFSRKL